MFVGSILGTIQNGPDLVRFINACQRTRAKFTRSTATAFGRLFCDEGAFRLLPCPSAPPRRRSFGSLACTSPRRAEGYSIVVPPFRRRTNVPSIGFSTPRGTPFPACRGNSQSTSLPACASSLMRSRWKGWPGATSKEAVPSMFRTS